MKEKGLDTILYKFFTGSLTADEEKELNKWINKTEHNAATFHNLKSIWKERAADQELVNSEALIDEIWDKGVTAKQRSLYHTRPILYKAAAVFIVFLIAGFLVTWNLFLNKQNDENINIVEQLVKSSPPGAKTKINLSEGSTIYLNSGSKIRYVKNFTDTSRIIYLKGEAFFEVARDSSRPFTVITETSSTTALGTSFNINTYFGKADQIALFDGKVEIVDLASGSPMLLDEGEMAVVNGANKLYNKTTFDKEIIGGWKDGVLVFSSASFDDFKKKIELWYDVTVVIDGNKPQDWKLTAKYRRESLEHVMNNLSFEKDFKYELENDSLTLKFR